MSEQDAWTAAVADPDVWRVPHAHARRHGRGRRFVAGAEKTLRRADASLVALAILLASLLAAAWQSGGYFPSGYLRVGAVAAAGVTGLLLLRPPVRRLSRPAVIALVGLLAFTAWTWLARGWSPAPAAGLANAQRDLVYVVILALAVIAAGSGRIANGASFGVLGVMLIIVLAGLTNRLFVQSHADLNHYRLAYPLNYFNAYGVVAVMAALLCAGVAADRRSPLVLRSLSSAAALLCLVGMYLSLSRGAWLCLGIGGVVLLLAAPRRLPVIATFLTLAAAFAAALLALRSLPALVDNPVLGHGQLSAAHRFLPVLALLAIGCGGTQAVAATLEPTFAQRWQSRSRRFRLRLPTPSRSTAVAVAAVVALAAGVALGPMVGREVTKIWHSTGSTTAAPNTSARLTTLASPRHDLYRVGFLLFKSAPIVGVGSGGYQAGWYRDRHVDETVINAHSLYIETLAELGIIGLGLLLVVIATVAVAAVQARARRIGVSRMRTATLMATVAVYLVHTGIDWDWQVTSVTGLALVLMAMLMPKSSKQLEMVGRVALWRQPRRVQAVFGSAAAVTLVIAIYLWGAGTQAGRLVNANRLGDSGLYAQSLAAARTVSAAPASAGAAETIAYDLQDMGQLSAADAAFQRAARANPSDWTLRLSWADLLDDLGDRAQARVQLSRARALNPFLN